VRLVGYLKRNVDCLFIIDDLEESAASIFSVVEEE